MNPTVAIISAVIAVVTLVFAIFAASWLNQHTMEKLLDQMEKRFDARFDGLQNELRSEIRRLDQNIESLRLQTNERLARIERQLEAIFKPVLPPR